MLSLNENEANKLIYNNPGKLIIIDCFAKWCGPCKAIAPYVDQLEGFYGNSILVGKVDVDECDIFTNKYNITLMPTFLFFKDGIELTRVLGADMNTVNEMIRRNI